MKAEIYARKGEICTCTNGHPIFTFRRNVRFGVPPRDVDTYAWRQTRLKMGDPITNCAICGAKFATNNGGFFVHIGDAWRKS